MPTSLFAGPISPLCTRKKNSTAKVFNSNFISSAAARKLTQQPLESKVTLGSPLTVLYANRPATWAVGAGLLRAYLCKSDWVRAYCWSACAGRRHHKLYFTGSPASVFRRGGVEERGKKVGKTGLLAIPRMEDCWFDEHLFLPPRFYKASGCNGV